MRTLRIDDQRIDVEHLGDRPGGGCLIAVAAGTRRWRVAVTAGGTVAEIEASWRDGELATLDAPPWMDDLLGRLAVVA